MAVTSYRRLIDAEEARRRLFSDGLAPGFIGDPSEHLRLRLEAVNRLREGNVKEAAETLARAEAATPEIRGRLNDVEFESLRDADDLLGGVLEVMAMGRYYWVGLDQVVAVAMNPPQFPRDLLFIPARLELAGQGGEVFLPALYPDSHRHPDDQVRLGRMTDWDSQEGGPTLGIGLHTYLRDEEPITLLEWRAFRASGEPRAPSENV
jgi:type VI secretion system protein ImpE